MKRIGIVVLSVVVMFGAMASWAVAQKTLTPDYRAQLEAALGGKILAVQKTMRYPAELPDPDTEFHGRPRRRPNGDRPRPSRLR